MSKWKVVLRFQMHTMLPSRTSICVILYVRDDTSRWRRIEEEGY